MGTTCRPGHRGPFRRALRLPSWNTFLALASHLAARAGWTGRDRAVSWVLTRHPSAVLSARGLIASRLSHWGLNEHADTAALLAAELVGDAVRRGAGTVRLTIGLEDGLLRGEVEGGKIDHKAVHRAGRGGGPGRGADRGIDGDLGSGFDHGFDHGLGSDFDGDFDSDLDSGPGRGEARESGRRTQARPCPPPCPPLLESLACCWGVAGQVTWFELPTGGHAGVHRERTRGAAG
ncbi:hypothetical protein GCM10022224_031500 [Nonomuraea antimicrobica]|uniref:Uncharacterized protein n=1 Tax=Nonomuraea antimicrobica TaxID=561173 RepID=A0ABP7BM46_9ACTN